MNAYYKYRTATSTRPWPDDIVKKLMSEKRLPMSSNIQNGIPPDTRKERAIGKWE